MNRAAQFPASGVMPFLALLAASLGGLFVALLSPTTENFEVPINLAAIVSLPVLALLVLAGVLRRLERSWLAPGAFFSLVWSAIVISNLIGAPASYDVSQQALWWIVLCAFVLGLGSVVAKHIAGPHRDRAILADPPRLAQLLPNLDLAVKLSILAAVISLVLGLMVGGGRAPTAVGLHSALSGTQSLLRMVSQLLHTFMFLGPLLGGVLMVARPGTARLAAMSLLPLVTHALVYTGRSLLAAAAIFWLTGFLTALSAASPSQHRLFTLRRTLFIVAGAITVGPILVVMQMLRVGYYAHFSSPFDTPQLPLFTLWLDRLDYIQFHTVLDTWERTRHLLFSYLAAFSWWFSQAWENPPAPLLGLQLMPGPLAFLGIAERPYFESVAVESGVDTNVFTLFRVLIEDFTLPGSLLILASAGFVASISFAHAARRRTVWSLLLLALFYNYTLWSWTFSPLRYNTFCLTFVVAGLFFWYERRCVAHTRVSSGDG